MPTYGGYGRIRTQHKYRGLMKVQQQTDEKATQWLREQAELDVRRSLAWIYASWLP